MSPLRPSLQARRVLSGVVLAVWAYALWRVARGGGGTAEAMVGVLAWGLGVIPVHVTLRLPRSSGRARPVRRIVRRHDDGDGESPTHRRGRGDQHLREYRGG
jgi:hypothetical protein